jgi:hypothetical protein
MPTLLVLNMDEDAEWRKIRGVETWLLLLLLKPREEMVLSVEELGVEGLMREGTSVGAEGDEERRWLAWSWPTGERV